MLLVPTTKTVAVSCNTIMHLKSSFHKFSSGCCDVSAARTAAAARLPDLWPASRRLRGRHGAWVVAVGVVWRVLGRGLLVILVGRGVKFRAVLYDKVSQRLCVLFSKRVQL
jgi:hypothetical protein